MTDWEELYKEGETPWDKGAAHPGLAEAFDRAKLSRRVLVPGCGTGHDVAAIASRGEISQVTGIDLAPSAVEAARRRLVESPHTNVARADLFALPARFRGAFDVLWEHTCFCAIDPSRRNDYVNVVANALRPGGHLLGIFFLRPWDTAEENATAGPPFASPPEELDRRFATRFEIVETWQPSATYEGREGREQVRLLRRI